MVRKISYGEYEEYRKKYEVNIEENICNIKRRIKADDGSSMECDITELEKYALDFIWTKCGIFHGDLNTTYVDEELLCMYMAIHKFMESGNRQDAFDIYCIYSSFFLGNNEKMNEMIHFVSSYEGGASKLVQSHRDHYVHSAYVFILGLAIYNSQGEYKKKFDDKYKDYTASEAYYGDAEGKFIEHTEEERNAFRFLELWGLTSLFHDIGYQFEIPFNQIRENNRWNYYYYNDYLHLDSKKSIVFFHYKNVHELTDLDSVFYAHKDETTTKGYTYLYSAPVKNKLGLVDKSKKVEWDKNVGITDYYVDLDTYVNELSRICADKAEKFEELMNEGLKGIESDTFVDDLREKIEEVIENNEKYGNEFVIEPSTIAKERVDTIIGEFRATIENSDDKIKIETEFKKTVESIKDIVCKPYSDKVKEIINYESIPKDIADVLAYHICRTLNNRKLNEEEVANKLRKKSEPDEIKDGDGYTAYMDHAYYSGILIFKQMLDVQGNVRDFCVNKKERLYARMDAITAITMHNKFFEFELKGKGEPSMTIGEHPLAYLLILCDELQCWDRTAFGRSSIKECHAIDCDFEFKDGKDVVKATYWFDVNNNNIDTIIKFKKKDVVQVNKGTLKKFLQYKDKGTGKYVYFNSEEIPQIKDWSEKEISNEVVSNLPVVSDESGRKVCKFYKDINDIVDIEGKSKDNIPVVTTIRFRKSDKSYLQGYHKEKPPETDGFNYSRYSSRPEGGSFGYSSSSKLSNGPLRPERWSLVYSTFSSTSLSISFLACAEGSAE